MNKTVFRFKFFDMPVSFTRSGQIGTAILIVICTILAVIFTDLTALDSLIAGILAMIIHWLSEFFHQYGHFFAAKQVGKPSIGIRTWWVLAATRYPQDEGELVPQIHIRRAIGGPITSVIVLIVLLILAALFWSMGGMLQFLIGWGIFIQIAIFILGALVPLKIGGLTTDGAILLREWRR